jgi:DNA primase
MPLYNQMLGEAVQHVHDPGFSAQHYFTQHPDPQVSQTAADMVMDRHFLSGRFVVAERDGELKARVEHLVMDLRRCILEQHMAQLQADIRGCPPDDMTRLTQLLQDFQQTQQLRDMLARQLGSDIVS